MDYLKEQSHCVLCPFDECIEDNPDNTTWKTHRRQRDLAVVSRWKQGDTIKEIARANNISQRTAQRIIKLD